MSESTSPLVADRVEQGVLVLTILPAELHGDETADAVRQEMLGAMARTDATKVAIDFRNVRYLTSACFRPLLSLRRKMHELGGQLVLCGMSEEVEEIFVVTRLITTSGVANAPFHREKDVDSAVAWLNRPTR